MLNQMSDLRNIELKIAYCGSNYFGWQIQPQVPTVQYFLQQALRETLGEPELRVIGSSRTDTGVHAHDQRVGFSTQNPIPLESLLKTLNHRLPDDIRILEIFHRPNHFSVRYGATGKHYSYIWCNRMLQNPVMAPYMAEIYRTMDHATMNALCQSFVGTKNFAAFQSSRDCRTFSNTTIYAAKVRRMGDLVIFDVLGHSFLYHMVRNMARSLVNVGIGSWSTERWLQYFESGDRSKMCVTAPAKGLHLFKVFYGDEVIGYSSQSEKFNDLLFRSMSLHC